MESKEITLVWLIRLFLRVYLLWKYNTKHPMLYYIDNNAQLTFYSLLSCNVTIQHYEKHVRIGKVRVLLFRVLLHLRHLFFSFFHIFPFIFFFFFLFYFTSFGGKGPILQREKIHIIDERRYRAKNYKLERRNESILVFFLMILHFFFFTFH